MDRSESLKRATEARLAKKRMKDEKAALSVKARRAALTASGDATPSTSAADPTLPASLGPTKMDRSESLKRATEARLAKMRRREDVLVKAAAGRNALIRQLRQEIRALRRENNEEEIEWDDDEQF